MMRFLFFITLIMSLVSCSYVAKVMPDRKDEYKKSEALPDLEVPPDLTENVSDSAMMIPGEDQTTLSSYRQGQSWMRDDSASSDSIQSKMQNNSWLSIAGSTFTIWTKLNAFFSNKGYGMEVSDPKLGILETDWYEFVSEEGLFYRDKFKVFSEPSAMKGRTTIFVSNIREEKITRADASTMWIGQDSKKDEIEKQLVNDLNQFFNENYSVAAVDTDSSDAFSKSSASKEAEIFSAGDGKALLSIPEEYTYAWRHVENILRQANLTISSKDQDKGLITVKYFDASSKQKKGMFSRLAFWRSDEPEGVPYQISLTGLGNKTELIVLNESGDWDSNEDSGKILVLIQNQYNQL